MEKYESRASDVEEVQKRMKFLEQFGTLESVHIMGEVDTEKVIDTVMQTEDFGEEEQNEEEEGSTDIETPEQVVDLAENAGISSTVLAKTVTGRMKGEFFHIDLKEFELENVPETVIVEELSASLVNLSNSMSGDESNSSVEQPNESDSENEAREEASESSEEILVGDTNHGGGKKGVSKEWSGVESGTRIESTIEFFEDHAGDWVEGEDFANTETDLDPSSARDRATAGRALLNAAERTSLEIETQKVNYTDQKGGPRNQYRYTGEWSPEGPQKIESENLDEFTTESSEEEEHLKYRMNPQTNQHQALALLAAVTNDGEKNGVGIGALNGYANISKQALHNALSVLKLDKDLVTHDEEEHTWSINDEGLEVLDEIGGFQVNDQTTTKERVEE